VLLVDGLDVRALKEPDAEEALSVDETGRARFSAVF